MTGYWEDAKYGYGGKIIIRFPTENGLRDLSGFVKFWDFHCGSTDPYPYTGSYNGGTIIRLNAQMDCGTIVMHISKNTEGVWSGTYQVGAYYGVLTITQAH
jgi:hypothetical protein